jgi:hypothetical protein
MIKTLPIASEILKTFNRLTDVERQLIKDFSEAYQTLEDLYSIISPRMDISQDCILNLMENPTEIKKLTDSVKTVISDRDLNKWQYQEYNPILEAADKLWINPIEFKLMPIYRRILLNN